MNPAPFKLERYLAKHEFAVPHLLCCSDCETVAVADVLDLEPGAREGFLKLKLGYTESPGSPELRNAIAGLYERIRPEDVLVHAGAEEAIFIFMNVLLSPGDHVIVQYPCYQSLAEIAVAIGCEVTFWHTREEDHWEPDMDCLKSSLNPKTRAVIVNLPHNPTGYLMPAEKQRELMELSGRHGFLVFSDEVYRLLEYDARDRLPAACDLDERAVSLGVMSKSFGLAGLRIGWAATRNRKLLARMQAFKDYTSICNSGPSEFLAAMALRHSEKLVRRNLEIIGQNRQKLHTLMERRADFLGWTPPKAGPVAFPYFRQGHDPDRFCEDLRTEAGVLLLPGSVYEEGSRHFRIGFGRKNFTEGLRHLEAFLDRHHPRQ
ncbi:MAG: aminotransferase class I/II-fold pyridoxal phosphate-dependent enzyme [Thermodesulfobacteriota bacterium]